jgi:hypothetical protein
MTFAFLGIGLVISTLVHSSRSAAPKDSYASYYESDEFDHFRRLSDSGAHEHNDPPNPPPPESSSSGDDERWLTVPMALALGLLIVSVLALVGFCIARNWPRQARRRHGDFSAVRSSAQQPTMVGVPHLAARIVPGSPGDAHRGLRLAPACI